MEEFNKVSSEYNKKKFSAEEQYRKENCHFEHLLPEQYRAKIMTWLNCTYYESSFGYEELEVV